MTLMQSNRQPWWSPIPELFAPQNVAGGIGAPLSVYANDLDLALGIGETSSPAASSIEYVTEGESRAELGYTSSLILTFFSCRRGSHLRNSLSQSRELHARPRVRAAPSASSYFSPVLCPDAAS